MKSKQEGLVKNKTKQQPFVPWIKKYLKQTNVEVLLLFSMGSLFWLSGQCLPLTRIENYRISSGLSRPSVSFVGFICLGVFLFGFGFLLVFIYLFAYLRDEMPSTFWQHRLQGKGGRGVTHFCLPFSSTVCWFLGCSGTLLLLPEEAGVHLSHLYGCALLRILLSGAPSAHLCWRCCALQGRISFCTRGKKRLFSLTAKSHSLLW